jgi:hypothetical protein
MPANLLEQISLKLAGQNISPANNWYLSSWFMFMGPVIPTVQLLPGHRN